jgi:hypothetical protein
MKPYTMKKLKDQKPLPPEEYDITEHRILVCPGDSLQGIIDLVPEGVDLHDISFDEEPSYYDDNDLFFTYEMKRKVPEKTYLARMKKYEKELALYNKKQEKKV